MHRGVPDVAAARLQVAVVNAPSSAPTDADELRDLRELHGDVRKLMTKIGDLSTQIEKDQHERRALNWAKAPLWLLALAGIAIAVKTWLGV